MRWIRKTGEVTKLTQAETDVYEGRYGRRLRPGDKIDDNRIVVSPKVAKRMKAANERAERLKAQSKGVKGRARKKRQAARDRVK